MLPSCHEVFSQGHNLAVTLFFGALLGSITHCSGMCGPFVLAQISGFQVPEGIQADKWYRLLLFPYHLGRLTTYTMLGMAATAISFPLLKISALHILSPVLLILAGIMFLASAFSQLLPISILNFNFCDVPEWITKRLSRLLPTHSLWSGYILGLLLGFLPCGLVYAALMAVASTGNIIESAFAMLAFAAGTMPMLMVIGLGGKILLNKKYSWIKTTSAILMIFGSLMLFAMAGKGLI